MFAFWASSSDSRWVFLAYPSSSVTYSRAISDCSSSTLVSDENKQTEVSRKTQRKTRMKSR
jgi:hypothetical protein